jgi:hypothetical protein
LFCFVLIQHKLYLYQHEAVIKASLCSPSRRPGIQHF